MENKGLYLLLIALNAIFFVAIWHMSHNFMLKKHPDKPTKGVFKVNREDAFRYSEYIALAAFLLMDVAFVYFAL